MLERHSGLLYSSDAWVDITMEDHEKKAERVGYDLSLQLTRPGATLLETTNSLEVKMEPATYMGFLEPRVASEIKAVSPRFRLASTVFLDHHIAERKGDGAAVPTLEFMVRVTLLAGAGDTTVETVFVDGLASMPLVPAKIDARSLSYVWQARGRFELVPFCTGEACLSPRVRYQGEQRFDLTTEEYSYTMKATLSMKGETRGPGVQSSLTFKSDTKTKSKETSWNDVPW